MIGPWAKSSLMIEASSWFNSDSRVKEETSGIDWK